MEQSLYLMALGVPAFWLLGGLFCRTRDGARDPGWQQLSRSSSLFGGCAALTMSLLLVASQYGTGSLTLGLDLPFAIGALRMDPLSLTMLVLVNFIGVVVVRFSQSYLGGDPRHGEFLRYLCQTLAAVSLLALAGSLLILLFAWITMSLSLHRLLVFYGDRPRARLAARKKFFIARCADAALLLAVALLLAEFRTADIQLILDTSAAVAPAQLAVPAVLIVVAALLKSAQFPTHGWLTEVMEAPTPVSALLHAGIVNAGGFLIVRFAGLIADQPLALSLLLLVGGVTALFASLVMMTQRSIKGTLAYSTVAQMGFMLLQCGLGAFSSAMLHIVAHSLYKAHAFLASGSVVDVARSSRRPADGVSPALVLGSLVLAMACFVAWSELLGMTLAAKPAIFGLGGVLVLAVTHLVVQSARGSSSLLVLLRASVAAVVIAGLYFSLQALAAIGLEGTVPASSQLNIVQAVLMVLMVLSFALVTVLQWMFPASLSRPRWRSLWVHISNGLYINQVVNQFIARADLDRRSEQSQLGEVR